MAATHRSANDGGQTMKGLTKLVVALSLVAGALHAQTPVSGQALGAAVRTLVTNLQSGQVTLPSGGGFVATDVDALSAPEVRVDALTTMTSGAMDMQASTAQSTAHLANVNVLNGLITAETVIAATSSWVSGAAGFSATPRYALAKGAVGSSTIGRPASELVRISVASGISPRNGTSSRSAARRAPPEPNTSSRAPQHGQTYDAMFSIMPSTGVFSWLNIEIAFCATLRATSCGVDTTTAPVRGIAWHSVSCTSPVPGGRSTIR